MQVLSLLDIGTFTEGGVSIDVDTITLTIITNIRIAIDALLENHILDLYCITTRQHCVEYCELFFVHQNRQSY